MKKNSPNGNFSSEGGKSTVIYVLAALVVCILAILMGIVTAALISPKSGRKIGAEGKAIVGRTIEVLGVEVNEDKICNRIIRLRKLQRTYSVSGRQIHVIYRRNKKECR